LQQNRTADSEGWLVHARDTLGAAFSPSRLLFIA